LFPQSTELHLTARNAFLRIGNRAPVPFQDLSDGYRSMLALSIDLLRWLTDAFPDVDNPMSCPGVVLIDELDAHAHPKWQREIGGWLQQKFPRIQFIVATHSPFLAQVADEASGNVVLEDHGDSLGVRPHDDVDAVDTWRIDQILTELFDLPTTYKPKVEKLLNRHQELHRKRREQKLTKPEEDEYQQLTLWRLESFPPTLEDPEQRHTAQILRTAVDIRSDELKKLQ
jgi:predicted ATP-binding protein involved in virulence